MSQRKRHSLYARLARASTANVRRNHMAVVNIEPSGRQGLINWRTAKSISPSQENANAVCDHHHRWCIYISALCIDANGQRYSKSIEVAPEGVHLASQLTEVIEAFYRAHLDSCNQQHIVGSGWIAIPNDVTLDEAQAARIFEAVGAWPTVEAA